MSAHTPGLLAAGSRHRDATVITGGNPEFVICTTDHGRGAQMVEYSAKRAEDIANAARLAACWNACEGIPTEILAHHEPGIFKRDNEQHIAARDQRDELAAALRRFMAATKDGTDFESVDPEEACQAAEAARDALAKLERAS